MWLVDNDGNQLDPPISETVNFVVDDGIGPPWDVTFSVNTSNIIVSTPIHNTVMLK